MQTTQALPGQLTMSAHYRPQPGPEMVPVGAAAIPAQRADEVLPRLDFSTDSGSLPVASRFDAWRERVAGYYESALPEGMAPNDFHVETVSWHLGDLLVVQTSSGAREQSRSIRKLRTDGLDHYRLILQSEGHLHFDADAQRIALGPQQLLMTDMARPERYATDGGVSIMLMLPRELLDEALPRPMNLHGLVPQGSAATMLAYQLRALVGSASELTRAESSGVTRSTIQLIAAALSPTALTPSVSRPVIESTLLRQMCRHVELHLMDDALTPQSICTVFKTSRATLYRLFEPLGGVAAFIKERRLLQIHAQLSGVQRKPLVRLAEDYGFKSSGHFSHAFRDMFGYRPSDVRAHTMVAATSASVAVPSATASLNDWLRSLRG